MVPEVFSAEEHFGKGAKPLLDQPAFMISFPSDFLGHMLRLWHLAASLFVSPCPLF